MLKFLSALAVIAVASTPVVAQSPQPAPTASAQPKTVKKVVCKRSPSEQVSGSRLSSTTKVCKEVEVPIEGGQSAQGQSEKHSH